MFDHRRRVARSRAALAAFSCAVLLSACGNDADDAARKKDAAAVPQAVPVTVQRAELRRVPYALEAVGQAEGSREVEVRARVSGILEKRLFTEGAAVARDALLFRIDRRPYEIAVAQAKAGIAEQRAKQELAAREAERLKSLASARAISQREYETAQSALKQVGAAIEGAQARLSEAQLNLSYTNVRAPIGGITGRALKSEGSLVTAGNAEASLLATITQVNPIWVRFSLAEADFERIRGTAKGAEVHIASQNGGTTAKNGRLNFAGSTVDPKLGTVQLRAKFPNADRRWLPGQFVKVNIFAGEQEAFLVPHAAIVESAQARSVWIAGEDGKASLRPVQTAGWHGADWIVTGGLRPGEAVIVDNLMKMRPGVAVKANAPAAAAAQPAAK